VLGLIHLCHGVPVHSHRPWKENCTRLSTQTPDITQVYWQACNMEISQKHSTRPNIVSRMLEKAQNTPPEQSKENYEVKNFLPAIFRDFQCWLSMRPDIWPSPSDSFTPEFMKFPASHSYNPFSVLPTELLLIITSHVPISTLLGLSATSKSLRSLITQPSFLNQASKAAVLTGSAFWILPVTTISGEEARAQRAGMEWLALENSDLEKFKKSPFHAPRFPYFAFVHSCYESDSMRNRERFWKIVKQLDKLWRDYRLLPQDYAGLWCPVGSVATISSR